MGVNLLVIGSGGREHTLSWKLAQSEKVSHVYVCPGNAGTESADKTSNIELDIKDISTLATWCRQHEIEIVVVGPEDPLAAGIADKLKENGILCFGPSAAAAQIEASKAFSKEFMTRKNIPTARWQTFTEADKACEYINSVDFPALVVKASGLAAGKGVIVARDKKEACQAARDMLKDSKFGAAGDTIVVEELLEGEEISCLAFTDGRHVVCMPPAQDHKRLSDGDQGPNTGGMGAYCPCPLVSSAELKDIRSSTLQRAVDGMREDGMPYVGVLYGGLMLTKAGPRVLEYNCRFGDPETQVLMPMLKSDLYDIIKACVTETLHKVKVEFYTDRSAVAVVTVSEGYPGKYPKGKLITGVDTVETEHKALVFHAGTKMVDNHVVTNGGRVLAVVSMETELPAAANQARLGAELIQYEGKFFRKDIAHKAIRNGSSKKLTYSDSGVSIAAGDSLVASIKPLVATTTRTGCTNDFGLFGGLFDLKAAGYEDPLLVSGTDGVGTKLLIAEACGIHDTVGVDLVAMCVNDILCHGAEPLFFLDYFACGRLSIPVALHVLSGVTKGCKEAGCALLGGETAEMPGMYSGHYDLAGFAVGAVGRRDYLPRKDIAAGDILIGVPSTGIHSNGFSLVRRVVEKCRYSYKMCAPWDTSSTVGESLLTPTRLYPRPLLPSLRSGKVKAAIHITGGGLPGNLPRVFPNGVKAQLDARSWTIQPVYGWLSQKGNIEPVEMARTFNLGVGMVLVVSQNDADNVVTLLREAGEVPTKIGTLVAGDKYDVQIDHLAECLAKSYTPKLDGTPSGDNQLNVNGHRQKRRVGVLISGSGTNLQALIDHALDPQVASDAEIVMVISNKPDVKGLARAAAAGIDTKVIRHADFPSREQFDSALHEALTEAGVDIVCLAGFMRILTPGFVNRWQGRMLNVHPSLLPSFKGANAHKMALEAGVSISGCTVHFVAEEVDGGAIITQESVPVCPGDTEDTLAERVKSVEHLAFPRALELVASGKVTLGPDGKAVWKK